MIVHILKICTSYLCTFHEYFSFLRVLNLDIFPSKMLRLYLVCVICNSNIFHSIIFKLCIMIVHIEDVRLPFGAHLINIFLFFRAVELFSNQNA